MRAYTTLSKALAMRSEQVRQLRELLGQLPTDQQEALILRFFGEQDIGEIAARMGRSAGAIKMLIHRAVARLRDHYRQAEQAAVQAVSLMVLAYSQPQLQHALQPVVRVPRRVR